MSLCGNNNPCPDLIAGQKCGITYTGARYVPLFADPAEWSSTNAYEPLTIVIHEGNSYTSKTFVPVGIDISNEQYWALTGNYNAQIEAYRKDVQNLKNIVDNLGIDLSIDTETSGIYDFNSKITPGNNYYYIPQGDYNIKPFTVSNSIIFFDNVTLNNTEQNNIITLNNCTVYGKFVLDGRKSLFTGIYDGINLNNCYINANIEVKNCYGHGVQLLDNNTIYGYLNINNNGTNAGPSGTGDGLYLVNSNNNFIENATIYNNSRNGLTITSYNTNTGLIDTSLTKNNTIRNIISQNNGYYDVDIEGANTVYGSNINAESKLGLTSSINVFLENIKSQIIYGEKTDNIHIKNADLRPLGTTSNIVYLQNKCYLENINIFDTASSYSGYAITVNDPNKKSIIKNITIENCNNGCSITGSYICENINVIQSDGVKISIDGRRVLPLMFRNYNGRLYMDFNYKPGSGYGLDGGQCIQGDIVNKTQLSVAGETGSQYVVRGWVCIQSGPNESSKWAEQRIITGS